MKKVKIVNKEVSNSEVELTEFQLLEKIKEEGAIEVLREYEIPESFLLKWGPESEDFEGIDKEIVITMLSLSEDFIKSGITLEYFTLEDISDLNMLTYSNLSEDFIKEYEEWINWERMILYLSSSDKISNISIYKSIIEKFKLWNLISANDLSIDFIRENKEKLDWRILSIVKNFSEEEISEFKSEIPVVREIPKSGDFNTPSVKEIRKLIKSVSPLTESERQEAKIEDKLKEEELKFSIKHTIDNLTKDDLENIKNYLRNQKD
jgi:hypothetical protein